MSDSQFALTKFIYSIPTCRQTENLSTLLVLFNFSQLGAIAVLNEEEFPIGIVDYGCLLSLLSEELFQSLIVPNQSLQGLNQKPLGQTLPTATKNKTIESLSTVLNLQSIVKPTVTLTERTTKTEFLSQLKLESNNLHNQVNYLIVNASGKLLGWLDLQKLMTSLILNKFTRNVNTGKYKQETLSMGYSTVNKFNSNPASPEFSVSLLEKIPLPISIQTQSGKIIYCNQVWQQQINFTQKANPQRLKNNSINLLDCANQKIDSQTRRESEIEPHCLKSNFHFFPAFSDSALPKQKIQVTDSITEVNPQLNLTNFIKFSNRSQNNQPLWQYYRLPFYNTDNCYLVLALQSSAKEDNYLKQHQNETELEQLNHLKDKFLGQISHELKSPLTAIVGLSSLLKEQKLGELNQRQMRYAELIYCSGRKLTNIVNDLLDLTNLTTQKIPFKIESVDLKNICEEVYQQLINKLKASSIKENSVIDYPELKLNFNLEIISADRNRLSQILARLLKTCFKSTQTPQTIEIDLEKYQGELNITVKNSQLFLSEFHNLNEKLGLESGQSLINQLENLELDLIIARQIAKSYDGDIYFSSNVEQGSEFRLVIPNYQINSNFSSIVTKEELLSSASFGKNKPLADSNLSILIGTTNLQDINDLVEKLISFGYQPLIARTGLQVLEKARQLKPNKIILTANLPLLGTEDLLILLKADPNLKKIPILMLKSDRVGVKISNAQLLDGCIDLPLKQSALLELIQPIQSKSLEKRSLTILSLHPNFELSEQIIDTKLDLSLKAELDHLKHRVIEADCLEQGELLARIWQIDAIVIDGSILAQPLEFLQALKASDILAALPLVILDAKTTAAANQIEGLSVFPCLVPAETRTILDIAQVIQIATKINN